VEAWRCKGIRILSNSKELEKSWLMAWNSLKRSKAINLPRPQEKKKIKIKLSPFQPVTITHPKLLQKKTKIH
jgi:hypothetical protein